MVRSNRFASTITRLTGFLFPRRDLQATGFGNGSADTPRRVGHTSEDPLLSESLLHVCIA